MAEAGSGEGGAGGAAVSGADMITLNGLDAVAIKDPSSAATAQVYLHGATLTSYKDTTGREYMFVSSRSVFDGVKAIRGGIPIAFPQFAGDGPLPNHGFARTSKWTLLSCEGGTAVFELEDTPETRALWDFKFRLRYEVEVRASSLKTTLSIKNTGGTAFAFQALQHTYLATPAIEAVQVEGLRSVVYRDKVSGGDEFEDTNPEIKFEAETDRIYVEPTGVVTVRNVGAGSPPTTVRVIPAAAKNGVPHAHDVVVWNPWVDKSKAMGDFGDEEFHNMLCVEPGRVSKPVSLNAGDVFSLQQTLDVA